MCVCLGWGGIGSGGYFVCIFVAIGFFFRHFEKTV